MLASDTGQRMSALHSPLEYDVVFAVEACDGRTIMQQMISAAIVVIRQEMIARLPCRSQSLRSVVALVSVSSDSTLVFPFVHHGSFAVFCQHEDPLSSPSSRNGGCGRRTVVIHRLRACRNLRWKA